jgi:hypothetical protein
MEFKMYESMKNGSRALERGLWASADTGDHAVHILNHYVVDLSSLIEKKCVN